MLIDFHDVSSTFKMPPLWNNQSHTPLRLRSNRQQRPEAMKLEHLVHRDNLGASRISNSISKPPCDTVSRDFRRQSASTELRVSTQPHLNLPVSTQGSWDHDAALPSIHTLMNGVDSPAAIISPQASRFHSSYQHRPKGTESRQHTSSTVADIDDSISSTLLHRSPTAASPSCLAPNGHAERGQEAHHPCHRHNLAGALRPFSSTGPSYTHNPRVRLSMSTAATYNPEAFSLASPSSPTTSRSRSISCMDPSSVLVQGNHGTTSRFPSLNGSQELPPTGVAPKWHHHHHYISPSSHTIYSNQLTERYTCPTCNKPFSRPSSLRIHSHSHSGQKPFLCPHPNCGKAFSVRSNMRRHERGCHGGY